MSTYIRKSLGFSLFIIFVFGWISAVFGEERLMIEHPDSARGRLQARSRQLCVINYKNGVQNMLLSIYTSEIYGEKAAWIFPIPAKPQEITIDVVKDFPYFRDGNIRSIAMELIHGSFRLMRLSQVYIFPVEYVIGEALDRGVQLQTSHTIGEEVCRHIEKTGLAFELVTAETGIDLYNYLKNKSLQLPPELQSILDEYIGQKYSFVISWISDIEQFEAEARRTGREEIFYPLSISITFPTEKIYFPLKPISVYGDTEIPITIYVVGYSRPEFSKLIKPKSKVAYFTEVNYSVPDQLSSFFNAKKHFKKLNYTKISINSPSNLFKEDLWITLFMPSGHIKLMNFIVDNVRLLGLGLFILISSSASMFAGMIAFRRFKPCKSKFALFGLWNFLTLVGLAIVAHKLEIDTLFTQKKKEISEKINFWRLIKITAFIALVFSGFFWLWTILSSRFHYDNLRTMLGNFSLVFGGIFIFLLPLVYIFTTKNKQIRNFLILFSLIFLALIIVGEFLCFDLCTGCSILRFILVSAWEWYF